MHQQVPKNVSNIHKSAVIIVKAMIIKRDIIEVFKHWKDKPNRKPILLKGARQIGKTWAMETFGKECFEYYAKFDFDRQPEVKSVFQVTKDPKRILKELAFYSDVPLIAGKPC